VKLDPVHRDAERVGEAGPQGRVALGASFPGQQHRHVPRGDVHALRELAGVEIGQIEGETQSIPVDSRHDVGMFTHWRRGVADGQGWRRRCVKLAAAAALVLAGCGGGGGAEFNERELRDYLETTRAADDPMLMERAVEVFRGNCGLGDDAFGYFVALQLDETGTVSEGDRIACPERVIGVLAELGR